MKNIMIVVLAVFAFMVVACQSEKKEGGLCRIEGQMPSDKWDGKYMFLVPMKNTDSIGVDSVLVEGDKFVIETTKTNLMSVIRMDFHFRYGLQDLLVVTEPGTVKVKIGEESSGGGTPQNEALQQWKIRTQVHNAQYSTFNKASRNAGSDSVQYKIMKEKADSVHREYKNYTRKLAEDLKEGTLHDFLGSMFPTSYKRLMPDGSTKEFPLD